MDRERVVLMVGVCRRSRLGERVVSGLIMVVGGSDMAVGWVVRVAGLKALLGEDLMIITLGFCCVLSVPSETVVSGLISTTVFKLLLLMLLLLLLMLLLLLLLL